MTAPTRFSPLELFDLADGQVERFHIDRWELGEALIVTREVPAGKVVRALRVWPRLGEKTIGAPWWDITAGTLIEQLLPQLARPNARDLEFVIQKHGLAPRARFSVDVQP